MAVGSGTPYSTHTGNGVTVTFAFAFTLLDADDLTVTIDGVETSAYSVSGIGSALGGSITLTTAPAIGAEIILSRVVELVRETDYQNNGDLLAGTLNDDLDRLWMAAQQVNDSASRALRAPFPDTLSELPAAADRAGHVLGFDGSGGPLMILPADGTASDVMLELAGAGAGQGAGAVAYNPAASYSAGTSGAAMQALEAAAAALLLRERATINILPNTRWYVGTGLGTGTKRGATGLAMDPVSVSSYTTGSNLVVCNTSDTKLLAVGMLVSFSAAAHANMRITPCRVVALVTNTSFAVRLPNGLPGASSAACIATIVDAGGTASAGTGHGFDGWTKPAASQVWRDSWPANTRGGRYALGVEKSSSAAESHYVQFSPRDVVSLAGRTLTVGMWVKAPSGGSWRLFTGDNVNGTRYGATVSTSGYSWAEFTFAVPASLTTLSVGVELIGASGLPFYISEPFCGQGVVIGPSGGPIDLTLRRLVPVVKYTPQSFYNANLTLPTVADVVGTYSFAFDAYAETGGMIAPEVRVLDVLLEGINYSAVITGTGGRHIATRDTLADPIKYGPIMFQQAAGVKGAIGGELTLGADGIAYVYGLSGDNWANVSLDINGVTC